MKLIARSLHCSRARLGSTQNIFFQEARQHQVHRLQLQYKMCQSSTLEKGQMTNNGHSASKGATEAIQATNDQINKEKLAVVV